MRIFYTTDASLDPGTAPAHHVRAVCDQLVRLGHDVTLFAPSVPDEAATDFAVSRLRTVASLPRTLSLQPSLAWRLARAIRRQRPDVIYVRQSLLDAAPGLVALVTGIPLVAEVNGRLLAEWDQTESGALGRLASKRVLPVLQRFNLRAASAVVCVSAGIKTDLDERYRRAAGKTETVANGVDVNVFTPTGRDRARSALGLDPEARYACFVGALQPWQGLDQVVTAFDHLRSSPWRLLVVGDGVERERLAALVARLGLDDTVTFTGRLPVPGVVAHIGAADVCLYYPDRARGEGASPFKVYEYLACRRPVVAADLPGIRREFGDRLVYCDAEAPPALAKALVDLPAGAAARRGAGTDLGCRRRRDRRDPASRRAPVTVRPTHGQVPGPSTGGGHPAGPAGDRSVSAGPAPARAAIRHRPHRRAPADTGRGDGARSPPSRTTGRPAPASTPPSRRADPRR